jgi:hypothetical protein
MITTEVLYRAQDYPLQVFVTADDDVPIDLSDVATARFFILINKIEMEKYSLEAEDGFEAAIAGVEDNEIIVPIEGARMTNWPKGLMELRAEIEVNDTIYPTRMGVKVFQLGILE